MKKTIIAIQLIMLLFAFSLASAAAIVPDDGHYEGTTSQSNNISFDVIGGVVDNLDWMICPTCSGGCWGFGGWGTDDYAPYFSFTSGVNQAPSGLPSGIVPNASGIVVFGYGSFDTVTSASGGIWHAVPYYTGNGFDTNSCFDDTITYTAVRTGPIPPYSGPSQKTITIIEK